MFEKLLSVMPYNPGLVHQMAFYGRRMRSEASIRRTGVVFIALAFIIQFTAVISPPQPTSADGDNSLISGGFENDPHPRQTAAQYCDNNVRNYGDILANYGISCDDVRHAEFDSINLNARTRVHDYYSMGHNSVGATHNIQTGETDHQVEVSDLRGLNGHSVYWRQLNSFVSRRDTDSALRLKNSQGTTFWILYECGNLVSIGVPNKVQLVASSEGLSYGHTHTGGGGGGGSTTTTTTPTPTTPTTSTTVTTTPTPTPTTPTPVQPTTSTTVTTTPVEKCKYNQSLPANSPDCYEACHYYPSIPASSSECKPCEQSINSQDTKACISISKAVTNITQSLPNANGTQAHAGDTIVYTISAKNNGKKDFSNYVFNDSFSDVLDYADISDAHGASLDKDKYLSWPAEKIKAGATATHQITVKVKTDIPQTPTDTTDPAHYDLTMVNIYGNAVSITLPSSPAKTIETTATSLPNTGPGTSLTIAAAVMILAGYFYARARLLAKESAIAVKEMAN